jgi:hypothetical protein
MEPGGEAGSERGKEARPIDDHPARMEADYDWALITATYGGCNPPLSRMLCSVRWRNAYIRVVPLIKRLTIGNSRDGGLHPPYACWRDISQK